MDSRTSVEMFIPASLCQIHWQVGGSSLWLWLEPFCLSGGLLFLSSFLESGRQDYRQLVRTGALVTSESYNKWKSLSPLPPFTFVLLEAENDFFFSPPVCFGVFHPERKGLAYGYNRAFRAFWRAADVYLSRYK